MLSAERARRGAWFVIGALMALVVLLAVSAIFQTRQSSVRNQETLRIVKGCTTPGSDCYDRGVRQTARAVADINRVVVLAASCADQPDVQTTDEIEACILRELEAADK